MPSENSLDQTTPNLEAAVEAPVSDATDQGEADITKLLKALETERDSRKKLEVEIKAKTLKEREVQSTLEKYKQIDPERYEKLLKAEQEREENELLRKKNYEELKTRYQQETEASRKQASDWQGKYEATVIETAIKTSFFENGGKKSSYSFDDGGEEVPPVEAILNLMRPRIRLEEGGKVVILSRTGEVELNAEGRPKTLTEKMMEFRKGSMGALFDPQNNAAGSGMSPTASYGGQTYTVFSKDQARNGKASIDQLASGKALVQ